MACVYGQVMQYFVQSLRLVAGERNQVSLALTFETRVVAVSSVLLRHQGHNLLRTSMDSKSSRSPSAYAQTPGHQPSVSKHQLRPAAHQLVSTTEVYLLGIINKPGIHIPGVISKRSITNKPDIHQSVYGNCASLTSWHTPAGTCN